MSFIKIEDVKKQLEEGLEKIFESERFHELLKVMSKQKNYSLNNSLMIALQKPDATMVKGFKEWQKLGRHVMKGEKAIKILAPVIKKMDIEVIDPKTKQPKLDENGNKITSKEDVITGFRLVSVFDISQTEGKEIPSVQDFINRSLKDDTYMSQLYKDYLNFLKQNSGLDIREDVTEKGVGGYYDKIKNEIVISNSMNKNDSEKFRVLIHEYAHALLHGFDKEFEDVDRGHKEAQAESVAYVVSHYYGLDTSDISNGYIATWAQNIILAKAALEQIQKVAHTIIDEIQLLQKDKINEFENQNQYSIEETKKYLTDNFGISNEAFENANTKNTILQLLNKENGIVMTGKLEYSDKSNTYYFRTNRNIIEPLSEIMPEGRLTILNKLKENDVLTNKYQSLNEDFVVKKKDSTYVIQHKKTEEIISKQFETRQDALDFKVKAAIGQSLIHKEFVKNYDAEKIPEVDKEINDAISKYVSHHSKKELVFENSPSERIAWTILKNPSLKTLSDLTKFINEHQHVSSYKNIELNVKEREPELTR